MATFSNCGRDPSPWAAWDTTVTTSSRWKLSSSDRPDCSIPQSCPRGVVRLRTRIPTSSGLRSEYAYLARKFSLRPIDGHLWRFLRLRPQNFPTIRIVQLARLYHEGRAGLSRLVDCASLHQVAELLATSVTPYWETHYLFGLESRRSEKRLSASSIALLTINTAVPMLFAYGRHKGDEKLCDRAFDLLEALSAEKNHIVETWKKVGLKAQTAGDSQALIQLKRAYCDRKECLRCRFGYEYLKKTDHDKNR